MKYKPKNKNSTLYKYIYFVFIFLRIALLWLPFVSPIIGWFVLSQLDAFDYVFAFNGKIKLATYEVIDKILDILFRISLLISVFYFHWAESWLFTILFIYRLIGDFLMFDGQYERREKYLIYFPNIIDFLYPLYILLIVNNFYFGTTRETAIIGILIVALIGKLIHEYLIHTHKIDGIVHNFIYHYV